MNILLAACPGIPLVTAMILMLFRASLTQQTARWVALVGTLATLLAAVMLTMEYRTVSAPVSMPGGTAPLVSDVQDGPLHPKIVFQHAWFQAGPAGSGTPIQLEMLLGVDGISCLLIVLTALLTVCAVLTSWDSVSERSGDFFVALMVLESGLAGVFCAFDLILFYVFFEMTLIPLFFLIAIWGGPDRRRAALRFFLYTLAGSVVTLSGVILLVLHLSSQGLATPTSLPAMANWLRAHPLPLSLQASLFLTVSAGFLIKVPVFPFHTWLPLAHVEAPTAGSVLLAGVLLKLGTYGFLRICLPLFPDACVSIGLPLIGMLSVIGIGYGSLCALVQRDIKKLVAYSSVAHLGFCMLGLFALNVEGLTGSVLQMINHGLSTGALFLIVGMIYERYHSRMLDDLGGLATRLPLIGCTMVFIAMASIGLPGLNGFVGEFLSLAGMFRQHWIYAVIGTGGVVLGAWYLLTALQHMFFGPVREPHHAAGHMIRDLSAREFLSVAPLAVLCLWIGVRPAPLIDFIRRDVESLAALYDLPDRGETPVAKEAQATEPVIAAATTTGE